MEEEQKIIITTQKKPKNTMEEEQKKTVKKQKKPKKPIFSDDPIVKLILSSTQSQSKDLISNYYKDFLTKTLEINYNNLNQLLSSTLKHMKHRRQYFGLINMNASTGNIHCIYTDKIVSECKDLKANQLEFTDTMKWDEEHIMPQSYHSRTKIPMGRDIHQIFVAWKSANGQRGNKPFGYYKDSILSKEKEAGKTFFLPQDKRKKKTFIPNYNVGMACRASLYALVCYKNSVNHNILDDELLEWMKKTAKTENISDWEKERNNRVQALQGTRNPFVDFPEWIDLIDFSFGFQ